MRTFQLDGDVARGLRNGSTAQKFEPRTDRGKVARHLGRFAMIAKVPTKASDAVRVPRPAIAAARLAFPTAGADAPAVA